MTAPRARPQPGNYQASDAERKLLQAAETGKLVDLRTGDRKLDDPAQGATWRVDRTVQAETLIELLTGQRSPEHGRPRAVKLRGARITGELNLEAVELACLMQLTDCYFEKPINLDQATAPAIRLPGCHMPALSAEQLRTTGNLDLRNGFTAHGEVWLVGARIGGELNLGGASITNPGGNALVADGLTVDQGLFGEGFTAMGKVSLVGAHIGGQLSLNRASLTNENGPALDADGLTVDQGLFCGDGFTAVGEIRLLGGHIGAQFVLDGASLANEHGPALSASLLTVSQSMLFGEGFTAMGQVILTGAHVCGQLSLDGASLTNEDGPALIADGLTVDQEMFCGDGFTARGAMSLLGARLGGLVLNGASLANENGPALSAERVFVDGSIFGGDGFTAIGEVSLAGAHISEQLNFSGARLTNPAGAALSAGWLTVGQDMFCSSGFTADGEVQLLAARIDGELDLNGARLGKSGGTALNLQSAKVSSLSLLLGQGPDGAVDLTGAKVGTFLDQPATWPDVLSLTGFTYDRLGGPATVKQRLDWLRRNEGGYTPQIYDQLAAAYRYAGDRSASRKVEVAKQRRCRTPLNPLNWLWFLTVGYGYRTWRAGIWLVALVAIGTIVFGRAYPGHMIAVRTHPPAFHAVGYALDTLLPIVNLGEKSAWQPEGTALYWSWVMTLAGWTLTTAVVAGLTGVLKRD